MEKIEITKKEIVDLYNCLEGLKEVKGSVKFVYAVAKTRLVLKTEVDAIKEAIVDEPKFLEFEQKRVQMCYEFADKDEKGETVIDQKLGKFKIEERKEEFAKEFEKLREENKEALELQEKRIKEINDMYKESIEISVHKINLSDLPDNLNSVQMEILMPLILEG